jgi:hypothetical protein
MYEGFAPHVDYANIPISNESSPGKSWYIHPKHIINTSYMFWIIESKPDKIWTMQWRESKRRGRS